jgi:hypothetical protein
MNNEMLDETINTTIEATKKLTYEQIISVTNTTPFIIIGAIVWFLPLFLYVLVAINTKPRGASGQTYKGNMLSTLNGWIPIIIWGIFGAGLLLLGFYFPVWANL